jgi:rRNA maturation endonuclease Nob1
MGNLTKQKQGYKITPPEYKCESCGEEWILLKPKSGGQECPYCGHLYVKWINYEEE